MPAEKLRRKWSSPMSPCGAIGTGKTAYRRAGRRGLHRHPRHHPRTSTAPGWLRYRHRAVRRLHEAQQRRRSCWPSPISTAASSAAPP
ncbi:MAG: hypothetical protein ACLU38_05695 [Dysosmobacter sp.]